MTLDFQRFSTFQTGKLEDGFRRMIHIEGPSTQIKQGAKIETPYGDLKVNYTYLGNGRMLNEYAIGAPFIELRIRTDHKGFHRIRLGSQEDAGIGAGGTINASYFLGVELKRRN